MPPLLRDLLRPYRGALALILAATLVQILMGLAAPVAAQDHPRQRRRQATDLRDGSRCWFPMVGGSTKTHIAAAAGIMVVLIAVVSGIAFYVASYTTERVGQSIGNDLRVRLYHHLQELSLAFYDSNRVGTILSTLTTDVQTIQSFRVDFDPQHLHRRPDPRRDDRCDAVAALGFRPDRARGDPVS